MILGRYPNFLWIQQNLIQTHFKHLIKFNQIQNTAEIEVPFDLDHAVNHKILGCIHCKFEITPKWKKKNGNRDSISYFSQSKRMADPCVQVWSLNGCEKNIKQIQFKSSQYIRKLRYNLA